MMLTLCVYKYIFVVENELRELHQRIVSISILTEGNAGGLFHNIVFIALFICLRIRFYIFFYF
jgi:hypothetical protein